LDEVSKLSSEGLRCLAIAEVPKAGALASLSESNKAEYLGDISKYSEFESGAVFLGIVCIKDPVREEVKPAIKDCKMAGIRVIMITGDSKETATAIAKELDIIEEG
jgi:P-type E1-E2 ATPase